MKRPVIFTGLRANNDLHIGNYFGALMPIIDMAKNKSSDYKVYLMMADLHSFSTPIDHSKLQEQIISNLRVYAAAGMPLNDPNICIFRESHVPAHSELSHLLDCFSGVGELSRMTQYKDKSAKVGKDRVSMALLNYPVLMAADILLYDALYIPVGDDQTQHVEFARDIADRINNKFGDIFTVPMPVEKQHKFFGKDQGLRIKDLVDPSKKMSKSDDTGKGVIFLSDSPAVATKKIMSATTDGVGRIDYDQISQPGISNLLDIFQLLGGDKKEFIGQTQYGPFKSAVAQKMSKFLTDFQNKLNTTDVDSVLSSIRIAEESANTQANTVLMRAQKAIGLR